MSIAKFAKSKQLEQQLTNSGNQLLLNLGLRQTPIKQPFN